MVWREREVCHYIRLRQKNRENYADVKKMLGISRELWGKEEILNGFLLQFTERVLLGLVEKWKDNMGRQNLFQKRSSQLRYKEDKRNTGDFEEKVTQRSVHHL